MVHRCRSYRLFLTFLTVAGLIACSGSVETTDSDSAPPDSQIQTQQDQEPPPDNQPESNQGETGIRILMLGDSITQGDKSHQSYRYPLWKKLVDHNSDIDLVGSLRDNFKGNPQWPDYQGKSFDRDHEGHWGWRVDEILARLDGWLNRYVPDIALIHLGTNDVFQEQSIASTIDELEQLVSRLRRQNPNIILFIAKVIPSKYHQQALSDLNREIETVIAGIDTEQSPIIIVDHSRDFNASSDTYDGVHPNAKGEEIMAKKWMDAMIAEAVLP